MKPKVMGLRTMKRWTSGEQAVWRNNMYPQGSGQFLCPKGEGESNLPNAAYVPLQHPFLEPLSFRFPVGPSELLGKKAPKMQAENGVGGERGRWVGKRVSGRVFKHGL